MNTLTHEACLWRCVAKQCFEDALRAMEIFQGYERWTEESEKICEVGQDVELEGIFES